MPIPNTWKILIWRILTGTLSVGSEFQRRNMGDDVLCGFCGTERSMLETVEHLFRDCDFSARVWAGSNLGIRVEGARHLTMTDWFIDWVLYLGKQEEGLKRVILFIAIIWGIWVIRNKVKFDGLVTNFQVLSGALFDSIKERVHLLGKQVDNKGSFKEPGGRAVGTVDRLKLDLRNGIPFHMIGQRGLCSALQIKVDASWDRSFKAAFGWVAYDAMGREYMRRQVSTRAESALQAEALGVRDVVSWARSGGVLHLEISSDCLHLINVIAESTKTDHLIKDLLEEFRSSARFFHCLSFCFIPRHLNSVAHGLARQAMRL
ncbi:uncharacterized protein LOC141629906 [Silene latifolia]|uniref:uncharacterized protein LOC141629906 n=1 Tax=Silene latifolia TaxID=37657 RepID=UPI003D778FC9